MRGERRNPPYWLLALLALQAARAQGQVVATPVARTWVTDGNVMAVASTGTVIYVGGSFGTVGPYTGSWVPLDAVTGAPVEPYPKVGKSISAMAADGSGGWYISGSPQFAGSLPVGNIAHIKSDGTVDAGFNPNTDGTVNCMALDGSTLYIGGNFNLVGNDLRHRLAAVDATTGALMPWDPGADDDVRACAISGSVLYAGGFFTAAGGQSRFGIAAIDKATGLATPWDPSADAPVLTLSVQGSTIYAGGGFSVIGMDNPQLPRKMIAALDAVTGRVTAFDAQNADDNVWTIAFNAGKMYVGGDFLNIGGQTRSRIAQLNPLTGDALAWYPDGGVADGFWWVSGEVRAFAFDSRANTVYVGGSFEFIDNQPRNKIAALDATTGHVTPWQPVIPPFLGPTVLSLAYNRGTVFAGGSFSLIGGVSRNGIAAFDVVTGSATDFDPGSSGGLFGTAVRAIALTSSTIYVGGTFANIGGCARNNIAQLNPASGACVPNWNPNADNSVYAFSVDGSTTLYVGGNYFHMGGQIRNMLSAVDMATGNLLPNFAPNPDRAVNSLALMGDTLIAGGDFLAVGGTPGNAFTDGTPRNYLAIINKSDGSLSPLDANLDNAVYAVAYSGGHIYAGGRFTTPRRGIVQLDPATLSLFPNTWNANSDDGVHALAIVGSTTIYVGGDFTLIGGQIRRKIASLDITDPVTPHATAWDPEISGPSPVAALAINGQSIYAGGSFANGVGGTGRQYFVEIGTPKDIPVPPTPRGISDLVDVKAGPNPFRPSQGHTTMNFSKLPPESRLQIYTADGMLIQDILADRSGAAHWDAKNFSGQKVTSGIYTVFVRGGSRVKTFKIVIQR